MSVYRPSPCLFAGLVGPPEEKPPKNGGGNLQDGDRWTGWSRRPAESMHIVLGTGSKPEGRADGNTFEWRDWRLLHSEHGVGVEVGVVPDKDVCDQLLVAVGRHEIVDVRRTIRMPS